MIAYLCLGANIGNPVRQIEKALIFLAEAPGIKLLRHSDLAVTKPYGKTDQPDFHNQVVEIETEHPPEELLKLIQYVESKLGRLREEKWGPRLIDIDILLYEDVVLQSANLVLPHPDLHNRLFALRLLNQLIPDKQHPVLHKSVSELLRQLEDLEPQ